MIINLRNLSQDSMISLGENIRNMSISSWNSLFHFCFKNDKDNIIHEDGESEELHDKRLM